MTFDFSLTELRRLEAEATPGEWEATEAEPNDGTSLVIGGKVSDLRLIADCQIRQDAALIVAMRNALPELLKALEWQPIETAPIGIHLLFFPDTTTARRQGLPEMVKVDFHPVSYPRKPTHWMPLPLPPHGGVDVG